MLCENYNTLLSNISYKTTKYPREVLTVVSKTIKKPKIIKLLDAGHRHFGENYLQEATEKWPDLKLKYPDICLHMIGNLQSKKALKAIELFDIIESLDREKLAIALAKAETKLNIKRRYFIQVNIGMEPQKSGIAAAECANFLNFCKNELQLNIIGLMCIPPMKDEKIYFKQMQELYKKLKLQNLSMGMSQDYLTALDFGATNVRIGSYIFGNRPVKNL